MKSEQVFLNLVPPDPVVIFDETGTRRTTFVGPYLTGDSMTLVCDAFGGKNEHLKVFFSNSENNLYAVD